MSAMVDWAAPIALEGVRTVDGRLLDVGSLQVEGRVPLVTPGDRGTGFVEVGHLESIRRLEGGVILGFGKIGTGWLALPRGIAINLSDVEARFALGEDLGFSSARLRMLVLTTTPAWPECVLEVVRVMDLGEHGAVTS